MERIADLGSLKVKSRGIEITCNTIQKSISSWKEYLETMIEIINGCVQVNQTITIG